MKEKEIRHNNEYKSKVKEFIVMTFDGILSALSSKKGNVVRLKPSESLSIRIRISYE